MMNGSPVGGMKPGMMGGTVMGPMSGRQEGGGHGQAQDERKP